MKGRASESKIALEIETQNKADTDRSEKKDDKRKSPAVKPRNFDGTTHGRSIHSAIQGVRILL